MNTKIELHYGIMSKIGTQLKEQGFKYDREVIKALQENSEHVICLYWDDIITDKEKTKFHARIHRKVVAHVKKMNKPKKQAV